MLLFDFFCNRRNSEFQGEDYHISLYLLSQSPLSIYNLLIYIYKKPQTKFPRAIQLAYIAKTAQISPSPQWNLCTRPEPYEPPIISPANNPKQESENPFRPLKTVFHGLNSSFNPTTRFAEKLLTT